MHEKARFTISVLAPLGCAISLGYKTYPRTSPFLYEWETSNLVTWTPLHSAWWYWVAMTVIAAFWAILMRPPAASLNGVLSSIRRPSTIKPPFRWLTIGLAASATLSESLDIRQGLSPANGLVFMTAGTILAVGAAWSNSSTQSNQAMHPDGGCAAAGDRPNRWAGHESP